MALSQAVTRFGILISTVDQPRGLAPEIFIDRVQCVPQLGRRGAPL
jgi:hypothetical protein